MTENPVPSELEVARAIAAGTLASPSEHCGNMFFAMRLSGTGTAWREKHQEFVWRDPAIWLSDEMQQRVLGLPVIVQHPESGVLDGDELAQRVIGSVIHAYRKDDELWGIARVIDSNAARALQEHGADTSPAVTFAGEQQRIELDDGDVLLLEGEPALVDHIALVPRGVWSKGDEAARGVEVAEGTQA